MNAPCCAAKKIQSNNNYKPKTIKMKKTDLFNLALVCAVVLQIGAYSFSFAQANKAGSVDGKGSNAKPSVVDPGSATQNSNTNDAAKSAEEQKAKKLQLQNDPAYKNALIKQQQDAQIKAKMAKANNVESKGQAKGAYAPTPINGLTSLDAAPTATATNENEMRNKSNGKQDLSQISGDFDSQVAKIVSNATSIKDARLERASLSDADSMWQDFNDNLNKSINVEMQKLQVKLSSNAKN
jgi:hypothetical protein